MRRSVEGLAASGPGRGTVEQTAEAIGEAANVLAVTAEEVLGSDDLLLTEEVRHVAAQVSDEHPLGVQGRPLGERSPLRLGFSVGIGLLLAVATAEVVILAGHVLILLVIAVFIAVSLEPVVGFLCRRGFRRGLAVAAVVVVGLVLTALFLDNVVPLMVSEAGQVTHRLPALLRELQSKELRDRPAQCQVPPRAEGKEVGKCERVRGRGSHRRGSAVLGCVSVGRPRPVGLLPRQLAPAKGGVLPPLPSLPASPRKPARR